MKCLISIIFLLVLTGCATVFSSTTQGIYIQVIDGSTQQVLQGAKCTLANTKGITSFHSGDHTVVTVTKGGGALTPNCHKEGYIQSSYAVGESFNKVSLINVLFWPGFFVDIASGAMHEYPSHLIVYMDKK